MKELKNEIGGFSNEDMPDCDMSIETYHEERTKRGIISVSDGRITFEIDANSNCESMGYSWRK